MTVISQELVNKALIGIFKTNKIKNIQISENITVNRIVTFEINEANFFMKILTRKPTSESEFYRLEKEAKLINFFAQKNQNEKKNCEIYVPVPKIIHMECDLSKIGFKFIILEQVPGLTLDKEFKIMDIKEKNDILTQLARIVKNIHSVNYEMYGEIEEINCPRRFFSYENMLKANVRKSGRLISQRELLPVKLVTEAIKFVEDNLENLTFTSKPTLVHNDLNQTNIIVEKNTECKWKINAILDFEWAFAGNPIKDLFGLLDDFNLNKKLREMFLTTYFEGKRANLDEFIVERKINTIASILDSTAYGWIHFHPTKENLSYAKKVLKETLN